jgi:iron complex transport system ATP-binding protein
MIDLEHIEFGYRDTPVLRGVDFAMKTGQMVAIVGANGAGKSTLLRIVAGLLRCSGKVRVFDRDPQATGRKELARRMAYLAQSHKLAFSFRAIEVVLMGRYAHTGKGLLGLDSKTDYALAMQALRRCDVEALADRAYSELSGGEQRRVLIAQALCQEAELLLLDEPTAGLDPRHARDLFSMVRNECDEGRTALVVTHDLNLAARYCHQLLLLDDGRRAALGTPESVLSSKAMREAFSIDLHLGTLGNKKIPYVVPY